MVSLLFSAEAAHRIMSIYIPYNSVEDTLVWDPSKDDQFSVKSAYWLIFYEKFGTNENISNDHEQFLVWAKVWGLGLPPKCQLFIWKVVHWILAIKDALLKKKIEVYPYCSLCGV